MRIAFVLPSLVPFPIGGYRIVYGHANALANRGHQVHVVHPRAVEPASGAISIAKARLWPLRMRRPGRRPIPWFQFDPRVRRLFVPDLRERFLPRGDAIFATGWETAGPVAVCGESRGRKLHLIQGWEDRHAPKDRVESAWRLPMDKIVCSAALRDDLRERGFGGRITVVPNAIDPIFRITRPPAARGPCVGMLCSELPVKGLRDGLEALRRMRGAMPEIQARLFGTQPAPGDLPDGVRYEFRPDAAGLRDLYNECAVFLQPSLSEGWGLTSTEAMACGCALVTTDNGGSREFAFDGRTAAVVPVGNPKALAEAALALLRDEPRRLRIAGAGSEFVRRFTWDRAADAMEKLLGARTGAGEGELCVRI